MEKSVAVADAIKELVAARRAAGRKEEYCWGLNHRLSKFQEAFPAATVATITGKQIDDWLGGLACAPATRNTFRRDVCTLMSFCEKRGYCQRNEAMKTERATDIDKPPGIVTPVEAAGILCACDDDLIPYTAISLFAGLRASELKKLDWAEVDIEGGHNQVTRGWGNYFAVGHCQRSFAKLNFFVAHRLRQWLWRKHGSLEGKYGRWPDRVLFTTYGLHKLAPPCA